jgi:hypothetical protein
MRDSEPRDGVKKTPATNPCLAITHDLGIYFPEIRNSRVNIPPRTDQPGAANPRQELVIHSAAEDVGNGHLGSGNLIRASSLSL